MLLQRHETIRVLIVDDSAVFRKAISQALCGHSGIEVAGTAPGGKMALAKIAQFKPDLVTLDLEMPDMNGLEVLRLVRSRFPQTRVIMLSAFTQRGARETLEALSLGADDYVAKPAGAGGIAASLAQLQDELVPKIRQFYPGIAPKPLRPAAILPAPAPRIADGTVNPRVVVLGVSTGGPAALSRIVPQFPAGFTAPVLIVQHMPPIFTRTLAERLAASSRNRVEEAVEGSLVEAGKILIAPGDFHMTVKRTGPLVRIALDQSPPENSCRPSVDVLFRSAAEVYGGAALGVVLTGMGQDGLQGAQALKSRGASVLAQDQASSVVWGMPGSVVNAGLADKVMSLDAIVPEIVRRVSGG